MYPSITKRRATESNKIESLMVIGNEPTPRNSINQSPSQMHTQDTPLHPDVPDAIVETVRPCRIYLAL